MEENRGEVIEMEVLGRDKTAQEIRVFRIKLDKEISPVFCFAVRLGIEGHALTRPYSPISVAGRDIVCAIKIYTQIEGKEMLTPKIKDVKTGDFIRVLCYTKKIPISEILSPYKDIFMISAGTGITPMMQVLFKANQLETKHLFTSVSFNSSSEMIIFRDKQIYPHLNIAVTDIVSTDREKSLQKLEALILPTISGTTLYLVCGTDSFVADVAGERKGAFGGMLQRLGVAPSNCQKF
ncbi:cytochrome-b5 reductase [Nematocida displodere]|uniref:Cytochrome-b5 reductase n=1 Tax=Nematocida displodere TaxID=1805483 RepID=A0A177EA42_9MICR|nr:cytochrome-b5 reductase [Nematocida displodere]